VSDGARLNWRGQLLYLVEQLNLRSLPVKSREIAHRELANELSLVNDYRLDVSYRHYDRADKQGKSEPNVQLAEVWLQEEELPRCGGVSHGVSMGCPWVFNTVCLLLDYSGNPGVNDESYRGVNGPRLD
jgi:hypothetical protein